MSYLSVNQQFELAEKLSRALADYLDGVGDYPRDVIRMPLAEYIVDEVIDKWASDLVSDAIDLEHRA